MIVSSALLTELRSLPDEAICNLPPAQHPAMFRLIMERHNQRLFRVARGIVRDDSEAEDVLQESYVKAFSAVHTFRGEALLLTWLTTIVINEARARLRKRKHVVGLEVLDHVEAGTSKIILLADGKAVENPEAHVARAQVRYLLEQAIDDLPEAYRLVLILRDVQGVSIEDTAVALGLSPNTVKTRLHRARAKLRQHLTQTLGNHLSDSFPFLGARCERITTAVLARL